MTAPQPPESATAPEPTPVQPLNQPPETGPATAESTTKRNVPAMVALILAVVGFVFACIPGALGLGWLLLSAAFVVSIVSLFRKGRGKGLGITALVVSIVGSIVGAMVFLSVVVGAVDDALSGGDIAVVEEGATGTDALEETSTESDAAAQGTRDNPYPLGSTVANTEWEITINSVTFNADKRVMAEDEFNDAAPDGSEYILINVTEKYIGEDPEGSSTGFVFVNYVTPDGVTVDGTDTFAVAPDALDSMTTLYTGGSTEGNIALAVPSKNADAGVLAVQPGMLGDTVFVAVK